MHVVIAGASGLIGSSLLRSLRGAGHHVRALVRSGEAGADRIPWDPAAGLLDAARLEGADAVINLSGENVGAGRWSAARRERIMRSRLDATRTLVCAIQNMQRKPAVLLNASAIGFYGDRGDEILEETSQSGRGFLPQVCQTWEQHAEGAAQVGVRVAMLRFGVVLASNRGALAKMLPLFRWGLGGRFGSGRQWMSWVGIEDVTAVVQHALGHSEMRGPINVVAPHPVTNADFTRTLAAVLHRPAMLPVPAWALRLALGQMADEALLASARAVPTKLDESGYVFRHPTLESALRVVV